MSRYRLLPTPAQEAVLRGHCAHARYVWNLAVEQHRHWHPGRKGAPGYMVQCRQLTEARAEYDWLAAGSQTVQQQALRDFARAMAAFFDPENPRGRPSWRKIDRDEGFRIVGRGRQWEVRRLSRHVGQVWVPKAGWVPGHNVRAKAGLNREILRSGWGLLARRLEDKAPGRVEKISPLFTSQRCSACGQVDGSSRESQAVFQRTACGYACNADVNAARNIAAGHAVTARGGVRDAGPVNREPQLLLQPA
jgi:Putative transposase DNA-binding domain/Helix-turn-helix domain